MKYIIRIAAISFAFFSVLSVSNVYAASYPEDFTLLVNEVDTTVTLKGKGDSEGKSTILQLADNAKSIEAKKILKGDLHYALVLFEQKQKIRLQLYHPDGSKLDSTLVAMRTEEQDFPRIDLTTVTVDGLKMVRVRAIKQTAAGVNKRFLNKRYTVKPKEENSLQLARFEVAFITEPALAGDDNADALRLMNYYRKVIGYMPVTKNKELTYGCKQHVRYMKLNNVLTHYEEEDNPGYTEEGEQAGLESDLSLNRGSMTDAVHGWIDTLYHRLPMLHSDWEETGFYYDIDSRYACLRGWNIYSNLIEYDEPIAFPTHKMNNVPTYFQAGETPDPLTDQGGTYPAGSVITLSFSYGADVSSMSVILKDAAGNSISGWKRLPDDESDPNTTHQRSTVSFIPKSPLNTNTTYTVTITGIVDSESYSRKWEFTTGDE